MVIPRPASTVALVRDDASSGLQVYLLRRSAGLAFVPGATVFPGGAVDEADHDVGLVHWCRGRGEIDASLVLGYPPGALAWWVAAVRETFEEVGLLLAHPAPDPTHLVRHREALLRGETTMAEVCAALGVHLDLGLIRYFGHWVTPHSSPHRYDTRFFVAPVPDGHEPEPDHGEAVAGWWSTPGEALAAAGSGAIELILPTVVTLQVLARFERCRDLLDALDSHGVGEPSMLATDFGRRVWLPGDGPLHASASAVADLAGDGQV